MIEDACAASEQRLDWCAADTRAGSAPEALPVQQVRDVGRHAEPRGLATKRPDEAERREPLGLIHRVLPDAARPALALPLHRSILDHHILRIRMASSRRDAAGVQTFLVSPSSPQALLPKTQLSTSTGLPSTACGRRAGGRDFGLAALKGSSSCRGSRGSSSRAVGGSLPGRSERSQYLLAAGRQLKRMHAASSLGADPSCALLRAGAVPSAVKVVGNSRRGAPSRDSQR